jgi:hypothetical protein
MAKRWRSSVGGSRTRISEPAAGVQIMKRAVDPHRRRRLRRRAADLVELDPLAIPPRVHPPAGQRVQRVVADLVATQRHPAATSRVDHALDDRDLGAPRERLLGDRARDLEEQSFSWGHGAARQPDAAVVSLARPRVHGRGRGRRGRLDRRQRARDRRRRRAAGPPRRVTGPRDAVIIGGPARTADDLRLRQHLRPPARTLLLPRRPDGRAGAAGREGQPSARGAARPRRRPPRLERGRADPRRQRRAGRARRRSLMAYAGHQFGQFAGQLGDGRAILLGEVVGTDGVRRDIQLKGSGRTPYSRGGDGRAALGPVLREYIVSEAMAALGVPTTRSLAAVTTGESVRREDDAAGRGARARRGQPPARRHVRAGSPCATTRTACARSPPTPSAATTPTVSARPTRRSSCSSGSSRPRPRWSRAGSGSGSSTA